jgi:acetyl-CoA C-acetyltransferase
MTPDPRTPVLVGAGQVTHRDGDVPSPLELMARAARAAAADSERPALLEKVQSVAVVDLFSWPVPDPGAALAQELGITPRETVRSARGGNGPIALLGDLAGAIADGRLDVALLAGGEAGTAFQAAMRDGRDPGWPAQPHAPAPTRTVGADRDPGDPAELEAGLIAPIFWYPLFEHALRGAAGRTRADHQQHLGELWVRFAEVARTNPYAWAIGTSRQRRGDRRAGPREPPGQRSLHEGDERQHHRRPVRRAAAVLGRGGPGGRGRPAAVGLRRGDRRRPRPLALR